MSEPSKKCKSKKKKADKPEEIKEENLSFIPGMIDELYQEREKSFIEQQVSGMQLEILSAVKKIIETLDIGPNGKGFNDWPIDKLISAREKLSRYSEPLGEEISLHESRSDFSYIWRKGSYASDWLPMKSELGKELDKITNVDIDNKLTEKYLDVQMYSMFHRRRADLLVREVEAIDRMIRSIDSRVRELERQMRLEHTPEP